MKIISASERMKERQGVKALIVGPAGVGKTSLLRTLNPATTVFVDMEAGHLAVQDLDVDTLRPSTWNDCRDLACFLTGPNPSLPAASAYSQAHYDAIAPDFADTNLAKYDTYFIDSITVAARLCFRWCEQQPESVNDRGRKNLLGTYGLLGREMIGWLNQLQFARGKNVIFVGILEKEIDEFKQVHWDLQIDGSKTGKELPGIVDEVITYQFVDFGDGQPVRAFVCTPPNQWQYPAKDRSGHLEQIEEPNLGKLLAKIGANVPRKPVDFSFPPQKPTTTEAA